MKSLNVKALIITVIAIISLAGCAAVQEKYEAIKAKVDEYCEQTPDERIAQRLVATGALTRLGIHDSEDLIDYCEDRKFFHSLVGD